MLLWIIFPHIEKILFYLLSDTAFFFCVLGAIQPGRRSVLWVSKDFRNKLPVACVMTLQYVLKSRLLRRQSVRLPLSAEA